MQREPPDADPHVRWCGGRRGEPGAYPIAGPLRLDGDEGPLTRTSSKALQQGAQMYSGNPNIRTLPVVELALALAVAIHSDVPAVAA
jgi:hypothetical protein